MNKLVDIDSLATAHPTMTREQKLLRLAVLVRQHPFPIALNSNLEHIAAEQLPAVTMKFDYLGVNGMTVFALAAADKTFQKHGLPVEAKLDDVIKFLGLERAEYHTFACDCGGNISARGMAERIEMLI